MSEGRGTTTPPKCAFCQRSDSHLLTCERCRSNVYCNRTCQLNDWPRHKPDCRPQNYILKVNLHPRFITDPRISRTLSCPATSTFAALHRALQVAFGWAGAHLYQFEVFNDDDTSGRENRRLGPEPVLRLTDLSEVTNDYLPNCKESSEYRLHQVLEDENPTTGGGRGRKNKTIHYTYDFGDGWEHIVSCAGRARGTEHFQCLDGEGHESAEDVGGYTGWKRLLEAFDLAKRNEKELSLDQDEMIKWYKEECRNGQKEGLGGREKWRWDRDLVNERLREVMVS